MANAAPILRKRCSGRGGRSSLSSSARDCRVGEAVGLLPVFVPAPSQVVDGGHALPGWSLPISGRPPGRPPRATPSRRRSPITVAAIAVSVRALIGTVYYIGVTLHASRSSRRPRWWRSGSGSARRCRSLSRRLRASFPCWSGPCRACRRADARQRELTYVLSASRLQMLRYLLIPSALPYCSRASRSPRPRRCSAPMTAEWAGADRGIGAMMLYALFSYDTPKVWLSVLLTCFLAATGFGIWAMVERL